MKEPEFFTDNWHKGPTWYENLFAGAPDGAARGEASTGYTKYPVKTGAPKRIASLVPDSRLIYLVRDPVARIRSHHRTLMLNGQENLPLDQAIRERPEYVAFSSYGMQVQQYLEVFSRDQLLIVLSEDLLHERAATLRKICHHVGVEGEWKAPALKAHFNRTGESREPRPIKRWLGRIPGFQLARERAPARVKELGWKALNRRVIVNDENTRDPQLDWMLSDILREDIRIFRELTGAPVERWGLV